MKAEMRGRNDAVAAGAAGQVAANARHITGGRMLAWVLVGIPLLWGVYQTVLNAMKLFK